MELVPTRRKFGCTSDYWWTNLCRKNSLDANVVLAGHWHDSSVLLYKDGKSLGEADAARMEKVASNKSLEDFF